MTSPVFIRVPPHPRFCRLSVVGTTRHATACLASIDATDPVELTATRPPRELFCSACRRDLEVRQQRDADAILQVRELGEVAEVDVEPAVSRAPTPQLRPRPKSDPPAAWESAVWDPDSSSSFDHLEDLRDHDR